MEESTKMTQFEEHREKKIEEKWWVPEILETILNCLTNITEVAEGEETENGVEKIFEKNICQRNNVRIFPNLMKMFDPQITVKLLKTKDKDNLANNQMKCQLHKK